MKQRLEVLQKLINKQHLDAVLLTNPYDISYFSNFSNFSNEEREGFLLVTKNKAYIITDGRYDEAVKKETSGFTVLVRTSKKTTYDILSELSKKHSLATVGYDENNIVVSEYVKLWDVFTKLIPFSAKTLREIKTNDEIQKIQIACAIGDKAFTFIKTKLKSGVTEKQIATELEFYIKKLGAELSFPSIVAFGAHSSVPHHQTGNQKLKTNDFVLLDFGVKVDNYCSDMTRTIVFGKATKKQQEIYQTVLDAQKAASDYLASSLNKSQASASDIDKKAREYIVSKGYPTIPHSLGHGIGLEVHESPSLSPSSKETLSEGMVFSIEPGIYIPGFGGVRIEDLFVIKDNKLTQLTKSPKTSL